MPRTEDRKVGNAISYGNVLWALGLSGFGAFRLFGPSYTGQHLVIATIWYWLLIAAGLILALVALLANTARHHHPAGPVARKLDDAHHGV